MVSRSPRLAKTLANAGSIFAAFVLALVVSSLAFSLGPKIEGALLPVTKRLTINQVEPIDANTSHISGVFEKQRDCDFLELEWLFVNQSGNGVGVEYEFLEPSQIRASGDHSFGPWRVDIRADMLADHSRVEAFHRCHSLWVTRTVIYP